MTPRSESPISNGKDSLKTTTFENSDISASPKAETRIIREPGQPSYVRCESKGDFINPFPDGQLPPDVKNERLNLNLGQRLVTPENKFLLWVLRFFNSLCLEWWEEHFFEFWKTRVPLWLRRKLTFCAWRIYFPLHKVLLGRRTGLHPDASPEYHALTTVMWWGRLFHVSVQRMRFSLSQLHVVAPSPVQSKIEYIQEHPTVDDPDFLSHIPSKQANHVEVKGLFLHVNYSQQSTPSPTDWTIFWVYGGAFLSGDTVGNAGHADYIGRACGMDVFLPEFRLVPESKADDIVWDVALAYRWLCQRRDPSRIIFLGISSGGALCTMIMQNLAKLARRVGSGKDDYDEESLLPPFVQPALENLQMPAGCVLFGPFVDFTEPSGSLWHYQKHDLIVNQRVIEVGIPYLDTHLPRGQRREYSPIHQSFHGLPPMCVTVSEHETTFDMTLQLVNRARRDGVSVTLGVWQYMCHVFSFLNAFVPEGQQSMDFCIEWIRQLVQENQEAK